MTRLEGVKYRNATREATPGEALILPTSPVDRMVQGQQFISSLGLDLVGMVDSPLVTLPIPRYDEPAPTPVDVDSELDEPDDPASDEQETSDSAHPWAKVRPEMMWHPLLWLPPRLRERYAYQDDAAPVYETDDQWAIRVMTEMSARGMYDVDSGEWVDVLSMVDVDVDDNEDWMRVSEWLLGIPDDEIDGIDLEKVLYHEDDPDWAIVAADQIEEPVRRTVWARTANTLLSWSFQSQDRFEKDGDTDRLRGSIQTICRVGNMLLTSVNQDGRGAHARPGSDTFWAETLTEVTTTEPADMLPLLTGQVMIHCQNIRDAHWDEMETFWEDFDTAIAAGA